MSRRSNLGLRRLLLWGLCALLLAAQHEASRHALSHLELHADHETGPHPEAEAGCSLCLASAAATHLAPPAAGAATERPQAAMPAVPLQAAAAAARASERARNRGPPSWG